MQNEKLSCAKANTPVNLPLIYTSYFFNVLILADVSIGSMAASAGASGVCGLVLTAIVGFIKKSMSK